MLISYQLSFNICLSVRTSSGLAAANSQTLTTLLTHSPSSRMGKKVRRIRKFVSQNEDNNITY